VHSKGWSFIYANEVVSYVGSMDIAGDRWDTAAHDGSKYREMQPFDLNHFHGWHGVTFRLRGPVALDVARHFYLQWNDPAPLGDHGLIYHKKNISWEVPNGIYDRSVGNLKVQLVRTLSCAGAAEDGFYLSFAPRGEYSFTGAFKKMVSLAKKYIYLEDQLVFYDEALQAVADALPHVDAVIIVTDDARSFTTIGALGMDVTVAAKMREYYQRRAMDLLMKNKTLASKVHIFQLAREGFEMNMNFSETWLYTHAKTYIVDDEFMLGGSHGIERTAFTNDIDLSIGVTDGTSGPDSFVGKLRRQIFAEYLMVDKDDARLSDPLTALGEFEKQAATGTARVRSYYPKKLESISTASEAMYKLYEPDGRCKTQNNQQVIV